MKQLLIISGKGGTGKTTIANYFIEYSKAKYFCDCDVDAPNLNLLMDTLNISGEDFFGMDKAYINNTTCTRCLKCAEKCNFNAIELKAKQLIVNDFLCEGCGLCEKICTNKSISMKKNIAGNLFLYNEVDFLFSTAELRVGNGNSGLLVSEVKKKLLDNIEDKNKEEIIIVDGSPGIGCPVIASINNVDFAVIVTEASLSGLSDLKRIVELARKFFTPIGICINRYDLNYYYTDKIKEYAKDENIKILGKVRYDANVIEYLNNKKSLVGSNLEVEKDLISLYKNTMGNMKGVLI